MLSFIVVVHIIVALLMIVLVLIQDSKSGSIGVNFGGGGSNSVLGATGGASLAQKLTRWTAAVFAVTAITLTYLSSTKNQSVVDGMLPEAPAAAGAAPVDASTPAGETVPTPPATETPAAAPTK
jgi:preprotein translocase subunit SecG